MMASELAMILYAIAQADEEVNVLERIDAILAPVRKAMLRAYSDGAWGDKWAAALTSLNPNPEDADD